ncbi:hypothetical protein LTR17_006447 [Elasticomyces elasticus]|nr:hypothetical protein LTR17_006447 [Elasticomyces elasticus]
MPSYLACCGRLLCLGGHCVAGHRSYFDNALTLSPLVSRLYAAALGDRLHLATLRAGRLRILDIGYGTGKWAIQMKGRYPQAEVIAIDIGNYPVDEYDRPVNFGVEFRPGVDFQTDDWGFENGTFDFIHAGLLCGSVSDWHSFVSKVTRDRWDHSAGWM